MYSLVNSNFNRAYNPSNRQNALSNIKKLLTSRDTVAQNKACGYLIEVISRHTKNPEERSRMIGYLLDNDITVFLCEATSNLDLVLFKTILTCLRLLWRDPRFFTEEHAAHAMTAVLRATAHYASSGSYAAVDGCLHFVCDLLNGLSGPGTTSPLSHQSAYSAEQLLACLNTLEPHFNSNPNSVLSSALVLHALITYQPDNLCIKGSVAVALVEVLSQWFRLLMDVLNHAMLLGDASTCGLFYVVLCQLGLDALRLIKVLIHGKTKADFVQTILADDQEISSLKQSGSQMWTMVERTMAQLVEFTKTEEYEVFLKFLLNFLYDCEKTVAAPEFCDVLFAKGYLMMLPQVQIERNEPTVRKVSTLILGEMLKVLADKYLDVFESDDGQGCARDIHTGLIELQYGIEKPQSIGVQLQKNQPYSLLIYIYFYCQSCDNPAEVAGPLLPYLVEHILRLPKTFKPPAYIIKALWLVFAISTISHGTSESLEQRVYLESAQDRLVKMLVPDPSAFYSHHPALLLWAFSSQGIPGYVRWHVLSQWLKSEDSIPSELTTEPILWELLLAILVDCKNKDIVVNCVEALNLCLEVGEDEKKQEFADHLWTMLPNVLSRVLIDCDSEIEVNVCYLLDIVTTFLPLEIEQTVCLKLAVLITAIFCKTPGGAADRCHYEFVCLKLALYLLGLANSQNDNRVLLTYTNRSGYLSRVLSSTSSPDDRVACAALKLLSYILHYYYLNKYQPKSILQIQTELIIKSLRRDSSNERGASLLQLIYTVLNSGIHTPLALSYNMGGEECQCNALRALMFRIQLMLCCRESKSQSLAAWKTLSAIFKHAIVSKNDPKLVATLTSQPWTHTLVQFQVTQNISQEFLTFAHNWLTLLKITVQKNQQERRSQMSKHSLIVRTLVLLKKNLAIQDDDTKEVKQKILIIVNDILAEFCVRFK